ncbi:MAG TPA: bifunctional phosphopantothenoylcysteine decarboxylase/phosphopantothenate--cysteine ligase CoaBC [Chitinophagales bacterium]|nr:bifunctional phosphopantothenoylcysteine decarboxylase/phosphopantothenate--cysteine ligase CoaBC [Chitinophagales bacterium]HNM67707.1 bifunctional phosphopantothenoylcysteine decarboxylase/phosphopantothenate--cysteine ligase CoaBC [Chitinophagales bacterium]
MNLSGKKIIVAVSGSIAAYKSAYLVRLLIKQGAYVQCVITESATQFIAPLTLATLSKNECLVDYTNASKTNWNNHVNIALWADAIIVAPASMNTIAKMANGLCDNLLLGIYFSARCPVFIAPAMDEDMWHHPSNQKNIQTLVAFGHHLLEVNDGELASGLIGKGRMAEPEEIIETLNTFFTEKKTPSKLAHQKILITAGPTYEPLDPVRFIGNHSSGKMGLALAKAAHQRGAEVTLIIGQNNLVIPEYIKTIPVLSAKEMYQASLENFEQQYICIFAAAVADYTPIDVAEQKIKKSDETLTLKLKKNVDIAFEFGKIKQAHQISVGFALETENEEEHAKQKIKKKNFDLIVLNSTNDNGAGFRFDTNKITIIDKTGKVQTYNLKSKDETANDILNAIELL